MTGSRSTSRHNVKPASGQRVFQVGSPGPIDNQRAVKKGGRTGGTPNIFVVVTVKAASAANAKSILKITPASPLNEADP